MRKLALLVATGSLVAGCAAAQPDDTSSEVAEQAATTCDTNFGINPTKASLAVAMAIELGRWEASLDLTKGKIANDASGTQVDAVVLSSAGLAQCAANGKTGCPKVTAILNLQSDQINDVINKAVFSATNFRNDLMASFQRQNDKINNQVRQEVVNQTNVSTCQSNKTCAYVPGYLNPTSDGQNNPAGTRNPSSTCLQTPEQHKLTTPTVQKGAAACGSAYDLYTYKATKQSGSALCQPDNLKYELAFFGWTTGSDTNPFLQFSATLDTVTIDPVDGDVAAPQNAGSGCPTYENDRANDPAKILLNTCCTTQLGQAGTMQSIPRNALYLGCKANISSGGTAPLPTVTEPCTPTATVSAAGSYSLNTTSSYCLKVAATINGWGVSSFDGRTLSIDTYPQTTMGAMPLPAPVNGAHYFAVGPGTASWAAIYFW